MNQLSTFSPFGEAFLQSFVENLQRITKVALWVILSYSVNLCDKRNYSF